MSIFIKNYNNKFILDQNQAYFYNFYKLLYSVKFIKFQIYSNLPTTLLPRLLCFKFRAREGKSHNRAQKKGLEVSP